MGYAGISVTSQEQIEPLIGRASFICDLANARKDTSFSAAWLVDGNLQLLVSKFSSQRKETRPKEIYCS
jgi:hypothetical protein